MKRLRTLKIITLMIAAISSASAEDNFKVAVPMRGNWENAAADLGQRAGIFKKHGLVLESLYTQGAGETLQLVISNSADIGLSVGAAAVLGAYSKGAPVRVVGGNTTGTNDMYWYVRAESPINSLKDATANTTIAYSTTGSSSHLLALGVLNKYKVSAKPTATGSMPATLTQVMSGQIDIGFATPPMGLQQLQDGKIRLIAHASEVPEMRDQTVRLMIVNASKLRQNADAVARFVQAYAESVDWMYSSDPKVLESYGELSGTPPALAEQVRKKFYLKEMLDPYRVTGLEPQMADAIRFKFLQAPLTKEQLAELVQVPKRSK